MGPAALRSLGGAELFDIFSKCGQESAELAKRTAELEEAQPLSEELAREVMDFNALAWGLKCAVVTSVRISQSLL